MPERLATKAKIISCFHTTPTRHRPVEESPERFVCCNISPALDFSLKHIVRYTKNREDYLREDTGSPEHLPYCISLRTHHVQRQQIGCSSSRNAPPSQEGVQYTTMQTGVALACVSVARFTRHIDRTLGSPINTFVIAARTCIAVLREEDAKEVTREMGFQSRPLRGVHS